VALQADLTTAGAVEKLFSDAVATVGRPDIANSTMSKMPSSLTTAFIFLITMSEVGSTKNKR